MAVRPELHATSGESTLLVCPPFGGQENCGCLELLFGEPPADTRLFGVTLDESLHKRLAMLDGALEEFPAAATLVAVDTGWEFSVRSDVDRLEADHDHLTVEVVSSPGEFESIRTTAQQALAAWADAPEQPAICLRSVTTMLQYGDQSTVLRLLDDLTTLADEYDAAAHYHVTRDAHDGATLRALEGVCDDAFAYDGARWRRESSTP